MASRLPHTQPSAPIPLTVQLSPMRRKHLRSVTRIEQTVYPQPWTTSLFMSELALRQNRAYTVARVGSLVVGYSGVMLAAGEAHITNLAVDPIWQGHGVATRLLLHDVRVALEGGVTDLTLEVRASNAPAQALYRKFGLAPSGVRKGYYADREDALIMWAHAIGSESYGMRLSAIEASVPGVTLSAVPK